LLLPAVAARAQAPAQARMNQMQYLNNLMANAQMMQPGPWAGGGGFNPGAANPAFGGPGFVNPYTPFGGGIANPYTPGGAGSNPYTPGSGSGGFGGLPGGGYFSIIPPQMAEGYTLMGTAQIMQAYGTVVTADQQARIIQEQAKQARIQTEKMRFDFEMYKRANTIPYSEEQRRIARNTLKRVQAAANPHEVANGKSLNILLHDLEGVLGKKIAAEPITMSEDVLKHVNVTTRNGNLGLLRNDGRFAWPPALLELLSAKEREEIEIQAQALVQKAINGVVPGNVLSDLQNTLENIGEKLLKKINVIPGDDYRIAKAFLADFNSARVGLGEPGNAVAYFNFQKWTTGGKSVQELVDYLVKNGLTFAPAVQGDEFAYRALQAGLAAYDIAYNAQLGPAAQPNNAKDE